MRGHTLPGPLRFVCFPRGSLSPELDALFRKSNPNTQSRSNPSQYLGQSLGGHPKFPMSVCEMPSDSILSLYIITETAVSMWWCGDFRQKKSIWRLLNPSDPTEPYDFIWSIWRHLIHLIPAESNWTTRLHLIHLTPSNPSEANWSSLIRLKNFPQTPNILVFKKSQ